MRLDFPNRMSALIKRGRETRMSFSLPSDLFVSGFLLSDLSDYSFLFSLSSFRTPFCFLPDTWVQAKKNVSESQEQSFYKYLTFAMLALTLGFPRFKIFYKYIFGTRSSGMLYFKGMRARRLTPHANWNLWRHSICERRVYIFYHIMIMWKWVLQQGVLSP